VGRGGGRSGWGRWPRWIICGGHRLTTRIVDNISKTSADKEIQWSIQQGINENPVSYPHPIFTDLSDSPPRFFPPLFHLIERLKTTPREGWRRLRIHPIESISDHMYRMSIITMLPPRPLTDRINNPQCTKIGIVPCQIKSLIEKLSKGRDPFTYRPTGRVPNMNCGFHIAFAVNTPSVTPTMYHVTTWRDHNTHTSPASKPLPSRLGWEPIMWITHLTY